jgi:hypothetical protein
MLLQCEGCGAQISVEAGLRTTRCPFCAAPAVIERPCEQDLGQPTFVLGFVITEADARARARRWINRAWLAPGGFRRADVGELRGIYVPAYLYTAAAHVRYTASIGEDYTVTETYTTTDSKGRTVVRTRTRIETEWRSLEGPWAAYVDDLVVTASRGVPNAELEAIEPFDFRALRRYTPTVLSGWTAEDPSLDQPTCLNTARQEAKEQISKRLEQHMPGDRHRGLHYEINLEDEALELVLVPVWVLAVRYRPDRPPVRLLVNGQTAALGGRAPRSALKIAILVVTALAAIALVAAAVWLGAQR